MTMMPDDSFFSPGIFLLFSLRFNPLGEYKSVPADLQLSREENSYKGKREQLFFLSGTDGGGKLHRNGEAVSLERSPSRRNPTGILHHPQSSLDSPESSYPSSGRVSGGLQFRGDFPKNFRNSVEKFKAFPYPARSATSLTDSECSSSIRAA